MDLRRIRTCTPLSRRAELHHSSQPCDQWGRDGAATPLSILITDTAVHCCCCYLLVVRQRLRAREGEREREREREAVRSIVGLDLQ